MKLFRALGIVVFFCLLLISTNSHALTATGFEGVDHHTYYGTTADNVTVQWDSPTDYDITDTFEILLHNPERLIDISIGDTEPNIFTSTFKCPKTGHWIVKVRTKHDNGDGTHQFSVWTESTDPTVATVNGEPKGWWLFAWLASTGPIETLDDRYTGP